jgi:hypothetical protein
MINQTKLIEQELVKFTKECEAFLLRRPAMGIYALRFVRNWLHIHMELAFKQAGYEIPNWEELFYLSVNEKTIQVSIKTIESSR